MKKNSNYIMTKIRDPRGLAKKAQIGVDLTINKIFKLSGAAVLINNRKIELPDYEEVYWNQSLDGDEMPTYLNPGFYIIEFDQGLEKLNPNENASIIQRSSLNRAGTQIFGSVYDPGFETDILGASMIVNVPLILARHERVAQILIDENQPVDEEMLYDGSWEGKANN